MMVNRKLESQSGKSILILINRFMTISIKRHTVQIKLQLVDESYLKSVVKETHKAFIKVRMINYKIVKRSKSIRGHYTINEK